MITNPQNLSTPSIRFKPLCIIDTISVSQTQPGNFQKRYYKYMHNLTREPEMNPFKKMLMPKTFRSLTLTSWMPGPECPIALVKKVVKPYRKYLRDIQGDASHPKIQKLLPLLPSLKVNLTKQALRMLAFHSNVKNLSFEMAAGRMRRIQGEADELLTKYKVQVSRSLAKMKDLTALSMSISREIQAANLMLELIEKSGSLDSLKGFSLKFSSYLNPADFQVNINKVRERLTHLSAEKLAWYSFFTFSGELANLSVLNLKLTSTEIDWGLLQFQNLPKLQKFILDFTADCPSSQINFFQNLTLPLSTEDFTLTLSGFIFSLISENCASYTQFFKRLQEAKRVKALSLKIHEIDKSKTAKFACLLIKCFENLEVLHLFNWKMIMLGSNIKAEPLDFQKFWTTAVVPSKETLKTIIISTNEILFSEKINALETGFPRLKKLDLGQSVSSAVELGRFCKKIPSLGDLTVKGVMFTDEEKLKMFLEDMKEIPKGGNFELNFNVENIKQESLIGCLKKYIESVEVEGRLGIFIYGVQVEDTQALGEILKLVVKKGCFEPFYLMTKNLQHFFVVSKTKIAQASNGLTLN